MCSRALAAAGRVRMTLKPHDSSQWGKWAVCVCVCVCCFLGLQHSQTPLSTFGSRSRGAGRAAPPYTLAIGCAPILCLQPLPSCTSWLKLRRTHTHIHTDRHTRSRTRALCGVSARDAAGAQSPTGPWRRLLSKCLKINEIVRVL